jgi:hypothetical protein
MSSPILMNHIDRDAGKGTFRCSAVKNISRYSASIPSIRSTGSAKKPHAIAMGAWQNEQAPAPDQ